MYSILFFRWNEESLSPVKANDIEELISMILDDSGLRVENRTLDRPQEDISNTSLDNKNCHPSVPIYWDSDRLNKVP